MIIDRRSFTKALLGMLVAPRRALARWPLARGPVPGSGPTFDVRHYGALGDGKTDDSGAFLAALTAAAPAKGTVIVPAGRYRVPRMLHIANGVGVHGVGPESVLDHDGGDLLALVSVNTTGVSVRSLSIVGRFAHGVVFEGNSDSIVSDCHISGGTLPRYGYSGGILLVGCAGVTVERCVLDGNGGPGYLQGSDIQCDGLGRRSHDVRILANECRSTTVVTNIRCYDLSRSEIRDNHVSGARLTGPPNHGYGILIYELPTNPGSCFENVVAGNTVSHTDGSGIYLVKSNRTRIEGNLIDSVALVQTDVSLPVAGIALNQSQEVAVRRNRITRSARAGISIASNRADVGHVEVRENEVSNTGGFGVHLRGILVDVRVVDNVIASANGGIGGDTADAQRDIEISGNQLSEITGRAGIKLGNATSSRVCDNIVNGCDGYAIDVTFTDDISEQDGNRVTNARRASHGLGEAVRVLRRPRGGR